MKFILLLTTLLGSQWAFCTVAYDDILNEVTNVFKYSEIETGAAVEMGIAFTSKSKGMSEWIYENKLLKIEPIIVERGSHAGINYRQLTKVGTNIACAKWEYSGGRPSVYQCISNLLLDRNGSFSVQQCAEIPGRCIGVLGVHKFDSTNSRIDLQFPITGHNKLRPYIQIQRSAAIALFNEMDQVSTRTIKHQYPDGREYVSYSRMGEHLICDYVPAHYTIQEFGICMMVFTDDTDGSFLPIKEVIETL